MEPGSARRNITEERQGKVVQTETSMLNTSANGQIEDCLDGLIMQIIAAGMAASFIKTGKIELNVLNAKAEQNKRSEMYGGF